MRPGRESGGAYISDLLALLHMAAYLDSFGDAAYVHISRGVYGVMFHFQEIAPAVLISLGDNRTSSDAAYRCTGRCRVINPMMRPISFEDRVETGVRKTGCDPEKV